ncbi:hypothetical protein PM082_008989 [Marasmius tenuissimus]|nr:hypothetical protein PM082_008989 [Marasmius tenuissimus]
MTICDCYICLRASTVLSFGRGHARHFCPPPSSRFVFPHPDTLSGALCVRKGDTEIGWQSGTLELYSLYIRVYLQCYQ